MADVNGYRFGVCECELNEYTYNNLKIKDLEIFEDYDNAYKKYIERLDNTDNPHWINHDLWIVWIRDGSIIQFDQLSWNTRCKIIDLTN